MRNHERPQTLTPSSTPFLPGYLSPAARLLPLVVVAFAITACDDALLGSLTDDDDDAASNYDVLTITADEDTAADDDDDDLLVADDNRPPQKGERPGKHGKRPPPPRDGEQGMAPEECDTDDAGDTDHTDGEARGKHPRGPKPPPPCETADDCAEPCADFAAGCGCVERPHNPRMACVPMCATADDCPAPPEGANDAPAMTCEDGLCKPPPPKARDDAEETSTDS